MFSVPASLLAFFYGLTNSYAAAIALITVVIMALITPLTLKSTKGMLEMQKLQPEMKRLQQQHKNDRQKLNEEMMQLYKEHKVNPLASCLPLVAQMPVFFIMYRVLHGLTREASVERAKLLEIDVGSFAPQYVSKTTELYRSLEGQFEMKSLWLDLSKTPKEMMTQGFGTGIVYALLVVLLAVLYWLQQRQIASRTVNPTMSAGQQKLMQYLPVVFAVFQLFFPTGLVLYYIAQTLLRIGQQAYITRRFYGGEHSLGRQAQAAGHEARELTKKHKANDDSAVTAKPTKGARTSAPAKATAQRPTPPSACPKPSGRVTPSTNKPAPSGGRPTRPVAKGATPGSRHPKPKKK